MHANNYCSTFRIRTMKTCEEFTRLLLKKKYVKYLYQPLEILLTENKPFFLKKNQVLKIFHYRAERQANIFCAWTGEFS